MKVEGRFGIMHFSKLTLKKQGPSVQYAKCWLNTQLVAASTFSDSGLPGFQGQFLCVARSSVQQALPLVTCAHWVAPECG